jgi:hypothetical protein
MKFLNGQLQLDSSLTGTTALFTSGLTVSTGASSGGITLQQNGILIAELRRVGNNNRSGLFLTNSGTVEIQFDTGSFSYIRSNNFGIGTATDAGYKLDVNGTVRFTNQLTVVNNGVSIGNVLLNLNSQGTGTISSANSVGGATTYITMSGPVYYNPTSGVAGTFSVAGQSYMASGTATFNTLTVEPIINNTSTYSGIFRGFYYNPTLTSVIGTTHRAIETVTGDVILGSTSGNVGIGTTDLGFKLSVSGSTLLRGSGTTSASYALATQNSSGGTTMVVNNAGNMLIGTTTDAGYRLDVNGTTRLGNLTLANGGILLGDVGGTRVFNTAGLAIDYGAIYPFSITGSGDITITPAGILTLKGVTHTYSATETYVVQKTTNIGHLQINFDISGSDAASYNYGTISGNVRIYPGEQSNGNGYGNVILGHNGTADRGNVLIGTSTNLGFKLSVSGSTVLRGSGTTSASYALATQNSSGGTTMVVNNAGNMLIGTTTDAGYKLDVNGTARVTGVATANQFNANNNGGSFNCNGVNLVDFGYGLRVGYSASVTRIAMYTNSGTERITILNDGFVGFTQTTPTSNIHTSLSGTYKSTLIADR